jgi:phosphoribosylformylglycinamidine cyclo-ligase
MQELADGYVAAAKAANVAIINGEIAQMGSLVSGWGDFPYHWGAACLWFGTKDRLFTGKEIKAGDAVVALRDPGFRTNGLSLTRNIFKKHYGLNWHTKKFNKSTIGLHVLTPSTIYAPLVTHIHGGFAGKARAKLTGVVHVTGGGIPEKLARVLRASGLGASLDNLFDPAPIVKYCQELGGVSDKDAYRAWHMGQGMLLITPEPHKVLVEAQKTGIKAQIAGYIRPEKGITIASKGAASYGAELAF